MSLPTKQIGVLTSKERSVLQTFPVFRPGPGEVLIKNVAVASNPKDWKAPSWRENYECIEGNDVAGIIVDVGEGVDEYKGGERVAAFTKLVTMDPKYGAYAQYTVAPATVTFTIPTSTKFEEAATLPLAFMTAALGLFRDLGLPEPPADQAPAEANGTGLAVIINGASSSVGSFAVQLAKRAGIFVVGVAGETSAYAEELGADIVIDYRQHRSKEELGRAIVEALKTQSYQCTTAFDVVSSGGSAPVLARAIAEVSPDKSGKVACVMSIPDEEKAGFPKGVELIDTFAGVAHGKEEKFASRFYRQLSDYLVQSKRNPKPIVGNRIKIVPGGLAGVPGGLDMLRKGQVHGEKLVYLIAQTPGVEQ